MGNFSISHYAGDSRRAGVHRGALPHRYGGDSHLSGDSGYRYRPQGGVIQACAAYLVKKAESLAGGLTLEVNGQTLRLEPISQERHLPRRCGRFADDEARLRLSGCDGETAFSGVVSATVHYHDDNFAGRAGWKEIVVTAGPGAALDCQFGPGQADRSAQLSNYPTDLLNSPPQDLEASFTFLAPLVVTRTRPSARENGSIPCLTVTAKIRPHHGLQDSPGTIWPSAR